MISRFLILVMLAGLASCAQQVDQSPQSPGQAYQRSPEVELNGAKVYSEVLALRGEAATHMAQLVYRSSQAEFQGPMRWRFVAEGQQGEQVTMQVKQVQIETEESGRKVVIHADGLGGVRPFAMEKIRKPSTRKRAGRLKSQRVKKLEEPVELPDPRWMASFEIPSVLQLFPAADGRITVAAKIQVSSADYSETEWVNFALLPEKNTTKPLKFRRTMIEYDGVPID
ncbi:hypothetical protein [Rubritalea marina]|uniref:hypothetical protein n=1 Tax=Rubritalea marina TaxID=361055 RepID=UPI0003A47795|nr:hypothetical protein [Rubritalea marina]